MIYLASASTPPVRAAMSAGLIGCILAPGGGGLPPSGVPYALDNGRYGKGWPGETKWWAWLSRYVEKFGHERCMFVTAPDVVGHAEATLVDSLPWLPKIRSLGVPAAFVAQNGCTARADLIPWGEFDVMFLGGDDHFKLGAEGREVIRQSLANRIPVHMGRVNSRRRIRYAHALGCVSADGNYIGRGPNVNLPRALAWLHEIATNPTLFD